MDQDVAFEQLWSQLSPGDQKTVVDKRHESPIPTEVREIFARIQAPPTNARSWWSPEWQRFLDKRAAEQR